MDNEQNFDEEDEDCFREILFHEGKSLLEAKYVYGKEIGKGAYGNVLCGYRKNDHCSVAIKVIPSKMIIYWHHSKYLKRRIPQEVLLLAMTQKINGVVSIEEFYEDSEQMEWYIVMERCIKTMDLFEYITSFQYLSESVACEIMYQLMIIIIDCHLLGVVHRDIKEENILIDPKTMKIWLIDFGSGCLMKDDLHTTYNGTLSYVSPEWLLQEQYRGCQLESWTLGVVLYSMLCGSVPFEDEEQILSGVVRFPRKLSNNSVDLILRCLESDPELRIQPVEMLNHPWVVFNRNICDSGRSSFDGAIIDPPASRKCSCSCGENLCAKIKEEDDVNNVSIIETVNYDLDSTKQLDIEWKFKDISKSLSPEIERKKYLVSAKSLYGILEPSSSYKSLPSVNQIDYCDFTPEKKNSAVSGYEENIDDNFYLDEDSLVISNDDLF